MLKKLAAPALALAITLGTVATVSEPAHADRRGGRVAAGVAAGIIGLGVLGAYAASRDQPRYYRESCYSVGGGCYWQEGRCFYNRFGDYVCRRGYEVCEPRRVVCN